MKYKKLFVVLVLFVVACSPTTQSQVNEASIQETVESTSEQVQDSVGGDANTQDQSLSDVTAIHTPVEPTVEEHTSVNGLESEDKEIVHWTMITPGNGVVCADGSPYSFWVHEGNPEKLFVYFQGFNRPFYCNDSESCSKVNYDDSIHLAEEYNVASLIDVNADEPDRIVKGVFDFENPDNPLHDFSIVYIPICTADLHWGNNLQEYSQESGETFQVYHQGYVNTEKALSWANENLPDANQVFVSGCEVGAAGSILHTVALRELFPDAQIAQLGEGYAGIFQETVDYESSWKVRSSLPEWLKKSLPENFSIADMYTAISTNYPDINFAQFNYAEDWTQAYNYTAQTFEGVIFEEDIDFAGFNKDLFETLDSIETKTSNFHSFTVYGEEASKLPSNCGQVSSFMELMKVEDTHYIDWLSDLVNGRQISSIEGTLDYEVRD